MNGKFGGLILNKKLQYVIGINTCKTKQVRDEELKIEGKNDIITILTVIL